VAPERTEMAPERAEMAPERTEMAPEWLGSGRGSIFGCTYNPHGACELVNDTGEFILGALMVKMRPASRHPVQASGLLR
jgi:hypothetical protein